MTSHEYAELLRDKRWMLKRTAIIRARPRCEGCGATRVRLHVHHGFYLAGRMPWDYPDSALHVLCDACHRDVHHAEPDHGLRNFVHDLAHHMRMDNPPQDPRPKLWEIAQANCRPGVTNHELMKLLSWLYYKRKVVDFVLLEALSRIAGSARNRYALLQPGGKALEGLIGTVAGERAAEEKAEYMRADAAIGLNRRVLPRALARRVPAAPTVR